MHQDTQQVNIVNMMVDVPLNKVDEFVDLLKVERDSKRFQFISSDVFELTADLARVCYSMRTDQERACVKFAEKAICKLGGGEVRQAQTQLYDFAEPMREGNLSCLVAPRPMPRAGTRTIVRQKKQYGGKSGKNQ
jgi:hypothetical protein